MAVVGQEASPTHPRTARRPTATGAMGRLAGTTMPVATRRPSPVATRPPAGMADIMGGGTAAHEDYLGSCLGEAKGNGGSDSCASPGDEGCALGEIEERIWT